MSGSVLHVHAWLADGRPERVLLAAVAAYLWLVCTRHEPLRIWPHRSFPCRSRAWRSRRSAWRAPICCARRACCTCCCRRRRPSSFGAFAGVYLIAIAAGVISNVPGGIGVFEAVLLLLLPVGAEGPPAGRAGRLSRHLLLCPVRRRARRCWARTSCGRIADRRCGWCGSGARFSLPSRRRPLRSRCSWRAPCCCSPAPRRARQIGSTCCANFVPLPILELSHLLGSAVGVGLLVIAHGLYRRLDAAWWLTDLAAVRRHPAVASQRIRLRGGHDARRRGHRAGLGARPLSAARIVDRTALLRSLDRGALSWC